MSRVIDGFAPSTDSATPSMDPSMAQQSVDGANPSIARDMNKSKLGVISQERLKPEIKLLFSANSKSN